MELQTQLGCVSLIAVSKGEKTVSSREPGWSKTKTRNKRINASYYVMQF